MENKAGHDNYSSLDRGVLIKLLEETNKQGGILSNRSSNIMDDMVVDHLRKCVYNNQDCGSHGDCNLKYDYEQKTCDDIGWFLVRLRDHMMCGAELPSIEDADRLGFGISFIKYANEHRINDE